MSNMLSKKKFTADLHVKLADNFLKAINNKHKCMTVFVDPPQAFDDVDFMILLQKVQNIGVTGNAFRYIYSFLNQRKASIKIYGF